MSNLFFVFALISVGVGIVSSMMITSYVSKRGVKINYFLWRILIFKYVNDYRKITKQETGKTGPWFYILSVMMNLALVFVIIGVIVR